MVVPSLLAQALDGGAETAAATKFARRSHKKVCDTNKRIY